MADYVAMSMDKRAKKACELGWFDESSLLPPSESLVQYLMNAISDKDYGTFWDFLLHNPFKIDQEAYASQHAPAATVNLFNNLLGLFKASLEDRRQKGASSNLAKRRKV